MGRLPFAEALLTIFQALICLSLALRMLRSGLYRKYRYFFLYIVVSFAQMTVVLTVPFMTNLYRNFFIATELGELFLVVLVVQEVYTWMLGSLTGIVSASRRFIRAAVTFAIVVSLMLLTLEKTPLNLTGRFFLFERAIIFSLLIFVVCMLLFLLYYPVSLSRNIFVYSIGFAFYFLAKAATLFIRNTGHQWDRAMSAFLLVVSIGCLGFWLVGLSRAGEKIQRVIGHRWDPSDQERLLRQLQSINTSLLRTVNK